MMIWKKKSIMINRSLNYIYKAMLSIYKKMLWCHSLVAITTAQLHSTNPELRFWKEVPKSKWQS